MFRQIQSPKSQEQAGISSQLPHAVKYDVLVALSMVISHAKSSQYVTVATSGVGHCLKPRVFNFRLIRADLRGIRSGGGIGSTNLDQALKMFRPDLTTEGFLFVM